MAWYEEEKETRDEEWEYSWEGFVIFLKVRCREGWEIRKSSELTREKEPVKEREGLRYRTPNGWRQRRRKRARELRRQYGTE